MVSKFRPKAPIVAATSDKMVMRKLCLSFGVYPVSVPPSNITDEIIELSVNAAVSAQLVNSGDLVVITAGIPSGVAGATNLIKVHIVGEILAKGIGIGDKSITGNVSVVDELQNDSGNFKEGDILVARSTDKDLIPIMEKASAFIVEEGGITSHAAIASIVLGKPAIVGVENAVRLLREGQLVTMDTARGLIYSGAAKVL
jgi:pyruvate kinase